MPEMESVHVKYRISSQYILLIYADNLSALADHRRLSR